MIEEQQNENPSEQNLFDKMDSLPPVPQTKKIQRSKNNVVLAGVCSGIADYLKIDAANIRVMALLTILIGGWGIVAYLITALLLPVENAPEVLTHKEKLMQRKENFRTVLSGILILAGLHFAFVYIGLGSSESLFIFPNGFVFPLVAVTIGILILTNNLNISEEYGELKRENYFRSRTDRMIAGVCGGFGKYLNVDSSALRILFVIASLLTLGMFAVVYLIFSAFSLIESE